MNIYFQFKDMKLKNLISDICDEHLEATRYKNGNIGYLWYMYAEGVNKGKFKPFIFLAELNLLVKTGYTTEEEKQNMISMLLSDDDDNAHLTAYAILALRNKRINEIGMLNDYNKSYRNIKYNEDILTAESLIIKKLN